MKIECPNQTVTHPLSTPGMVFSGVVQMDGGETVESVWIVASYRTGLYFTDLATGAECAGDPTKVSRWAPRPNAKVVCGD